LPNFLRYDMDRIENATSKDSSTVACVLVAVVIFLWNRCLETIEDTHTDTQTDGRDL
jgi:hypothetical protein